MNDFKFGDRLCLLRKRASLSQAQVGERLGVSDETVSKWESGQSEPGVELIPKLAALLNVTTDELLTDSTDGKQITKIVITGGPCAGKTTALSWIQNAFSKKDYTVFFVDETATQLISGGAAPWLAVSNQDFQKGLLQLQLDKEKAFTEIAKTIKASKILIVCDRAALDNKAYMTEDEFRYVLRNLKTNEVALRDQYDAVFHLVTAAKGAEQYYTLANNAARIETVEQASALDDKLIAAWTGHPHLRVIDNTTGFEEKMRRLIEEISSFLGEPQPLEIERKYLIEYPDLKKLEKHPKCQKVDILQSYLICDQNAEEIRIRQRGQNGHFTYFKTRKRKVSDGKRIEIEERLTQDEYLSLLAEADPNYRPIRKTRYCLSENGFYYEIDIYPQWKHQAIMEIELRSEDQKVIFPEDITVIREVTTDDAFSNHALAKIG